MTVLNDGFLQSQLIYYIHFVATVNCRFEEVCVYLHVLEGHLHRDAKLR